MALRSPRRNGQPDYRTTIRAGGVILGSAAVAAAAVLSTGAPLANSPIASARPTATVDGATDPDTAWKWFQKIGGPYGTMDDALRAWSSAMSAGDVDSMHAACYGLRSAAGQFQRILPGPNSRANFRLEGVVDDLYSASNSCLTLGPGANWDTAKEMLAFVDDAQARLKSAKEIMQPYG